jgi:Ca2+-binding RTX toxin-like protein
MLEALGNANQKDAPSFDIRFGSDVWVYEDRTTNSLVAKLPSGPGPFVTHQVTFGSDAADVIGGSVAADYLYGSGGADRINAGSGDDYAEGNDGSDSIFGDGGSDTLWGGRDDDTLDGGFENDSLLGGDGADTLIGGAGNDLLDGGKGHDRYIFNGKFGHDIIDDLDGDGEIWINGAKFGGGTWIGEGVFKDNATGWCYARIGNDLVIVKYNESGQFDTESGQITVRHWGESANVGITLAGSAPPAPPPTLTGDFEKALNGSEFGLDANGNFRSTGALAPNAQDLIGGTTGGDVIAGLGGNDQLSGFDGDDRLEGGEGDDLLNGGAGRDTLIGGAGIDFIFGSARGNLNRPWGPDFPLLDPGSSTIDTQGLNWMTLGRGLTAPNVPGEPTGWINIDWVDADGADAGNLIDGGAGRDVIYAGRGNDIAHGGDDADEVNGQGADDTLYGDAGNDTMRGDLSSSTNYFNAIDPALHGDDILDGGAGNDSMQGNGGQDTLYGGIGDDKLWGDDNSIDDTPLSIQDDDYLDGGEGNDTMAGNGGDDELFGGSGNDELSGDDTSLQLTGSSHGNDYLDGEDGNDAMNGGGRDDELFGGAGNDTMWGDVGSGSAHAAYSGNDYLDGETGDDWMSGGGRDDELFGGAGNDSLFGDTGASAEEVPGSYQGNDYLDGEDGNDQLVGNGGADTLFGGAGNDLVFGDAQADLTPDALHGADYLDGGDGADTLLGGGGNDTLVGGAGLDYLDGGAGDDTYLLTAADTTLVRQDVGGGVVVSLADAIVDTQGRNKYVLQGVGEVSVVAQASGELVLNFGEGNNSGVIVSNGLRGAIASVDVDGTVQAFGDWIATHLYDSVGVAGQGGDEEISTGRGNDTVSGGEGRDSLASAGGDDQLDGGNGDDVLQGGTGNDTLDGGSGNDTYLVNAGDGRDVLRDAAGNDRIVFGAGITPGQISAHLEPDATDPAVQHFVLDIDADTSLDFGPLGAVGTVPSLIESLQFADGTVWTPANLQSVLSNAHGSLLTGTAGDDTLTGTLLRDTIEGGEGADLMQGGTGDDTYVIHAGDSATAGSAVDVIDDSLGRNTLVFDAGTVATATLEDADGSVTLHTAAGSSLRLKQGLLNGIETVQVGDVTYRFGDWLQDVLTLSAQLTGNPGQTLIGGSGNDTLRAALPYNHVTFIGGRGDDTFTSVSPDNGWFNRYGIGIVLQQGDGHDVLTNGPAFHRSGGESNWLQFGSGISADSLHLVAHDQDAWTLQYGTQGDTLRLQHTGYSLAYDYEADFDELRFADGSSMSWTDLLARGVDVIVDAAAPGRSGSLGNDRFTGSAAGDTLRGLAGNDTLDGGAGDDLLDGGTGDDVYRYALGSGTDRLSDVDGINVLELGAGITAANTRVEMKTFGSPSPQPTLMLVFNETDRVLLGFIDMDGSFSWPVRQVRFADGTVWSAQDVAAKYLGGTAGDDRIYGLDTSDLIQGGTGADVLEGRNGNDTVLGGEGDDQIADGNGNDVMTGGAGNDTYITGAGDDVIVFNRGDGADKVVSGIEHVRFGEGIAPADIAVTRRRSPDTGTGDGGWRAELELLLKVTGTGDAIAIQDYFRYLDGASSATTIEFSDGTVWDQAALKQLAMTGTAGNDRLFGYGTDDLISGGAGNDELDGALGVDTLVGGTGDDTYTVDGADDVIVELAGEGTDTVKTAVGMTLADALENGTAIGLNLTLTGNAFDNVLTDIAVRSWNTTGNVTLAGSSGNDTYMLGSNPTIVVEAANEGIDTVVVALVGGTLGDNVENLIVQSGSWGTGNALDNNIQGNAASNFFEGLDGNDSLYGLAGVDYLDGGNGNDLLDGGAGKDELTGGLGDDTYVIDSTGDVVFENAGEGIDTLRTPFTTTLATMLENLTLVGTSNVNGTGNDLDNLLFGNAGTNTLKGGLGNDTYYGGGGNDTMNDTVATSNDVYRWGRGDGLDTITDTGGSDRIEISAGITAAQLTQTRSGNNLVLGISGVTSDKLTITNWYVGTANKIETIRLADGAAVPITVTALSNSAPTEKAMPAVVTGWDAMAASLSSTPAREGLPTPLHAAESQAMPSVHELAFSSASTRWNDHLSLRRMAS